MAAIAPHFPAMGLTRIADVTGLDSIGIPVCMAVRPNSRSLSVFQGKGLTLPLARVSAAMEAIETYHAENDSLEITTASYEELSREHAVCDPYELNLHPRSLYHHRLAIPWVRGYDLIRRSAVYVPYELVHLRFLKRQAPLPLFFQGSNGLASGNHLLEAISHAICEVVERDATALWELSRMEPESDGTILDPATIDSDPCGELLERIERAGLVAYLCDQTSDVGIPAFGCVISERDATTRLLRRGSAGGYGCHLSKEIALSRAITEAAQSRLTHISGARDDMYRHSYLVQQQSATNLQHWQQVLQKSRPRRDFSALPSLETESLDDDVHTQLDRLQRAGFEQVIAVDLTEPRLGIPVVKVIIPGAEYRHPGFHKRFGKRATEHTRRALVRHLFLGGGR